MTDKIIGFIGAGNMASSLIAGLISDGYPSKNIIASNLGSEKLQWLKEQFAIQTVTNNFRVTEQADVVVLAVKPNALKKVCQTLGPSLKKTQPLVISVAAGIRSEQIVQWLDYPAALVRAMPNTPALIGCGASGLFANTNVTEQQKQIAESILRAVGITVWLSNEKDMDTVTALSGSGPAYFLKVMETLMLIGQQKGLSADVAKLLTLQTALGAARMAFESEQSLSALCEKVTSPGGTTEAALQSLAKNQMSSIWVEALEAAILRAEDISKLY